MYSDTGHEHGTQHLFTDILHRAGENTVELCVCVCKTMRHVCTFTYVILYSCAHVLMHAHTFIDIMQTLTTKCPLGQSVVIWSFSVTQDDFKKRQHQETLSLVNPADLLSGGKLLKKTARLFGYLTASHSTFRHQ